MNLRDVPREAFRFATTVELAAGGEGKARRFRGIAYSGLPVNDHPYWGQVVFDLASTKAEQRIPVLRDHDPDKIVGHTEAVAIGSNISVEGVFDETAFSGEVAKLSDAGFPWQMSVNIKPGSIEEVRPGEKFSMNGHEVTGPAVVFRNSNIREVSFVPVGADANTNAIALSHFSQQERNMAREQELEQQVNTLTAQVAQLTTQNQALTTQNQELADRFTAQVRERRVADVKDLFTAIGLEYTEQAAATYIALEDTAFAAVSAQMKALKAKPGEHLFSGHEPSNDSSGGGKSALVIDAERRRDAAAAAAQRNR